MPSNHTKALETVGYEQWSNTPTPYLRAPRAAVSASLIVGYNCNELVRRKDVEALIAELLKPIAKPVVPKCCVCGAKENLHADGWHGYRCDGDDCVSF